MTRPPAPPAGAGPAPTRSGRDSGRTSRRLLVGGAVGVLGLLLAVLVLAVAAVTVPPTDRDALDPTSVEPDGSRALVQVLRERGVDVVATRRFADVADRAGTTVLVVAPRFRTPAVRDALDALDADLVLVAPDPFVLEDLGRPLEADVVARTGPAPPRCADPAARAAGDLDWSGWVYRPPAGPAPADVVSWCYPGPDPSGPTPSDPDPDPAGPAGRFVSWSEGGRRVVVLGSPEPLRNDAVARDGNAALALHVLGAHDTLVWWRVDPDDPALVVDDEEDEDVPPPPLAPPWVTFALVWLLLMGLLAMLWRGRRMGRLVAEPLPVLVRSTETAQGRAALYRQAGAHGRAAAILRADAVRRLASRLGLPPSTPAAEVVSSAAARAGPDAAAVRDVLAGPPPADAAALTRLADDLDRVVDDAAATRPDPVASPPP